jgi:hypothetical protein
LVSSTKKPERWESQRWALDNIIRVLGAEQFTGGSWNKAADSMGSDGMADMIELKSSVKKFSDIRRQCKRIASRREALARNFESQGHGVIARECYFIAAMLYGCARWSIWSDDDPELIELTEKINEAYSKYATLSDHLVQKVEVAFEGKSLYGYFHLPPHEVGLLGRRVEGKLRLEIARDFPCVVLLPGMDTFKEELVRLYGDKFLQRGFSVLAVDGPGQGETVAKGVKLTIDNYDRAGKAIMDFLYGFRSTGNGSKIVDKEKISINSTSFGSYWGPRVMAYDGRYIAGAFSSVCHEPGMTSLFDGHLPTYKPRHMWMCGIQNEDEFDAKYRPWLSLEGVGEKLATQSILIAAGGDDPLSPLENTVRFYNKIASANKQLLVYDGEEHGIADPLLSARIGDFMDDAFSGRDIKSGMFLLERTTNWTIAKPMVSSP